MESITREDAGDDDRAPLEEVRGDVAFDALSFEYTPGVPVLRNVSFDVRPGERVGIVGATGAGKTDVEVLRVGTDRATRGVIQIPGAAQDLAMDPKGDRGAVITDQGTYRFAPHDTNPTATLQKVGPPVRDVSFGADGTFYQLDKDKVIAIGPDGAQRWQAALTDGRKLVAGLRTLVWDGADVVWAIAADGTADALGVDGQVQDLTISADGKRAGVVLDGKRALVFDLQ